MTDAPPSRYKVVERERRLVVIDTRTGQPATRAPAPAASAMPHPSTVPVEHTAPRSVDDRSGATILRTSRLYDHKGPREIVMTQAFSDRLSRAIGGWLFAFFVFAVVATLVFPWLWLLPLAPLFQPKARAALRNWTTARLDEADQAAS
ncbi:hypothetical protein [Sphingomonas koreensis]